MFYWSDLPVVQAEVILYKSSHELTYDKRQFMK